MKKKEIDIICPNCDTTTKYHRDNFGFYVKLGLIIIVSIIIGAVISMNLGV